MFARPSIVFVLLAALLVLGAHGGCLAPSTSSCPEHSQWMEGNACTDSCQKELMRCTAEMNFGCFCVDDYRKLDGKCVTKAECPGHL